jgi:small GTP-binding protein
MSAKYIIKIVTLGDTEVGKTSIVYRYFENKFNESILSTIGIDFKTKYIKVRDASVKVVIWDTAGQEKFRNIAKQYYQGANGVLLVFDVSDRKSFERIEYWLQEIKENNKIDSMYIVIVANKIDLINKRVVTREEAEKYAEKNNISYFEVSAKTGEGVAEMFNNITKGTIDKIFNESQNQSILEDRKQIFSYLDDTTVMKKDKRCCM